MSSHSTPKTKNLAAKPLGKLHIAQILDGIVGALAHNPQTPREDISNLQAQIAELREATGEPEPEDNSNVQKES